MDEIKLKIEKDDKQVLRSKISNILIGVLNYTNPDYRTPDGFVRWGNVEADIHKALGVREETKKAFSSMLLEAVGGFSNRYRQKNGHLDWEAIQKDAYQIIEDI